MKFIVRTDSDDYVIGLDLNPNGVEIPTEVYESRYLTCYKYINGEFIFDDEKKERIDEERQRQEEESRLKPYVMEAQLLYTATMTDTLLGE